MSATPLVSPTCARKPHGSYTEASVTFAFYLLSALAGALLCYLFLRERLKSHAQMADAFSALSAKALRDSTGEFLKLAEERFKRLQGEASGDLGARQQAIAELVQPLRETLQKFEKQVNLVERDRAGAYQSLTTEVRKLEQEARKLSTALSSPTARGRWGEIQLRRVVEIAGMLENCDFSEQASIQGVDSRFRPDLIIRLPNEKQIVVDSKVPLTAYLAACETSDETVRNARLAEHARQIRSHLKSLGTKAYALQLPCSPEFVVAFLPGEIFFSAALQVDPDLLEFGVENNVILATPTTLIALLKAVAHGWNQEKVARGAQEIRKLGAELYDRIGTFAVHYQQVGKSLQSAQAAFEKGRNSMESRLLVTARKFEELGVATSTGAIPEALSLDFGVDDESGSDTGRGGENAIARRA
jgi:DNA recombination protein RmuC